VERDRGGDFFFVRERSLLEEGRSQEKKEEE
jgi:hypothetical protein